MYICIDITRLCCFRCCSACTCSYNKFPDSRRCHRHRWSKSFLLCVFELCGLFLNCYFEKQRSGIERASLHPNTYISHSGNPSNFFAYNGAYRSECNAYGHRRQVNLIPQPFDPALLALRAAMSKRFWSFDHNWTIRHIMSMFSNAHTFSLTANEVSSVAGDQNISYHNYEPFCKSYVGLYSQLSHWTSDSTSYSHRIRSGRTFSRESIALSTSPSSFSQWSLPACKYPLLSTLIIRQGRVSIMEAGTKSTITGRTS